MAKKNFNNNRKTQQKINEVLLGVSAPLIQCKTINDFYLFVAVNHEHFYHLNKSKKTSKINVHHRNMLVYVWHV